MVNLIVLVAFYKTRYVTQSDFSKLDKSQLTNQIERIAHGIPKRACLDTSAFKAEVASIISEKAGIKSSKCSKECGICFTVTESQDSVKQKASITIKDGGKSNTYVDA